MKSISKYIFIIYLFIQTSAVSLCQDTAKVHPLLKNVLDSTLTISIVAVGDLMCHSPQYNYARVKADSFNFSGVYGKISKYLQQADFTFGNLETVLAGSSVKYSGYPFFNTPDDYLLPLKKAGFNLLFTSNNHALDHGKKGLLRTIEMLNKNGIYYDGTFTSKKDRDSIRIFNIKGIRVAFLGYSYGVNGNVIPKNEPYLINIIDTSLIKEDIHHARIDSADIVLVYFHFGKEYQREPTKFQKEVVEKTIQYGADIIIGSHPHVIEPSNLFKTKNATLDSGFVAYSLGNFISNQRWRYSDAGVILTIRITKNISRDSFYISDVNYLPTWVFKGNTNKGREFIILPVEYTLSDTSLHYLKKPDIFKMKQAFEDTKKILTQNSLRIKLLNIDKK